MSSTIAIIGAIAATVVGIILGALLVRWLTPSLAAALGESEKMNATLSQHNLTLQQEHDRLSQEAADGKSAQLDQAGLKAQIAELLKKIGEKTAEVANVRTELGDMGAEITRAHTTNATLTERESQLNERLEKQALELNALQQKLQTEFENIANRILDKTSAKLSETSQKEIAGILDPLKERIGDFQKKVEDTYSIERGERISLQAEMKQFITANLLLGQKADNLASALRGEGQKRGKWGELVLERILESSGLHSGRDYVLQGESLKLRSEEGGIQRPDAIIYLPEKKHVVIDSKVTLTSYERHVECEDAEDRKILHGEFLAAVRKHVDELGGKAYQDNTKLGAHEFVLMFVPIEGALALAMRDNDGLFQYAWDRRVAIVGPTSLLMTLKVVSAIWRYQRQGENATQIAQRAGLIYDKLVGVVEALNAVGAKLGETKSAFDTALNRLSTGQGNALSQVKRLETMGVKGKKVMPSIKMGGEDIEAFAEDAGELPPQPVEAEQPA